MRSLTTGHSSASRRGRVTASCRHLAQRRLARGAERAAGSRRRTGRGGRRGRPRTPGARAMRQHCLIAGPGPRSRGARERAAPGSRGSSPGRADGRGPRGSPRPAPVRADRAGEVVDVDAEHGVRRSDCRGIVGDIERVTGGKVQPRTGVEHRHPRSLGELDHIAKAAGSSPAKSLTISGRSASRSRVCHRRGIGGPGRSAARVRGGPPCPPSRVGRVERLLLQPGVEADVDRAAGAAARRVIARASDRGIDAASGGWSSHLT